jgi:hypothetical protein
VVHYKPAGALMMRLSRAGLRRQVTQLVTGLCGGMTIRKA